MQYLSYNSSNLWNYIIFSNNGILGCLARVFDSAILFPMINLNDILKAANGQLFGEQAANLFTDFCLDPQQAGPNKLFVALRTDKGDTHQYIEEAIKNGVSGVLCVEPPTCDTLYPQQIKR
jgi:hypothetical protein